MSKSGKHIDDTRVQLYATPGRHQKVLPKSGCDFSTENLSDRTSNWYKNYASTTPQPSPPLLPPRSSPPLPRSMQPLQPLQSPPPRPSLPKLQSVSSSLLAQSPPLPTSPQSLPQRQSLQSAPPAPPMLSPPSSPSPRKNYSPHRVN